MLIIAKENRDEEAIDILAKNGYEPVTYYFTLFRYEFLRIEKVKNKKSLPKVLS